MYISCLHSNLPGGKREMAYRDGGRGGSSGGGSSGGFNRGPREMHDATCSDCGTQTQVPFKPKEGKPVYCKDCYMKRKNTSE